MKLDEEFKNWKQLTEEIKPDLGINQDDLAYAIKSLTEILADLNVFSIKVHNFHWNVTGPFFGSLHKLFDDIYGHSLEHIDKVAERIRQLGGVSIGSMKEFLEYTHLYEDSGQLLEHNVMIRKLVYDLDFISKEMRRTTIDLIEDQGTINMLAGIIEIVDKDSWFLRTHLV